MRESFPAVSPGSVSITATPLISSFTRLTLVRSTWMETGLWLRQSWFSFWTAVNDRSLTRATVFVLQCEELPVAKRYDSPVRRTGAAGRLFPAAS